MSAQLPPSDPTVIIKLPGTTVSFEVKESRLRPATKAAAAAVSACLALPLDVMRAQRMKSGDGFVQTWKKMVTESKTSGLGSLFRGLGMEPILKTTTGFVRLNGFQLHQWLYNVPFKDGTDASRVTIAMGVAALEALTVTPQELVKLRQQLVPGQISTLGAIKALRRHHGSAVFGTAGVPLYVRHLTFVGTLVFVAPRVRNHLETLESKSGRDPKDYEAINAGLSSAVGAAVGTLPNTPWDTLRTRATLKVLNGEMTVWESNSWSSLWKLGKDIVVKEGFNALMGPVTSKGVHLAVQVGLLFGLEAVLEKAVFGSRHA